MINGDQEVRDYISQTQENLENIRKINEENGNLILFIGSGFSTSAGYKNWIEVQKHLVEKLIDEINDHDKSKDLTELLNRLEYKEDYQLSSYPNIIYRIKKRFIEIGKPEKYYSYICDLFDEKKDKINRGKINDFHRNTLKIQHRTILTTNYDFHIEKILSSRNHFILNYNEQKEYIISKFITNFRNNNAINDTLHIHGAIEKDRSIVLSEDEYNRAYGFTINNDDNEEIDTNKNWTILKKILWALLTFNHVLFVGFGLKDPFLEKMLSISCEDSWDWLEGSRYAIIPFDWKEDKLSVVQQWIKRLKTNLGITTILYEKSDDFQELHDIVKDLSADTGGKIIKKDTVGLEEAAK